METIQAENQCQDELCYMAIIGKHYSKIQKSKKKKCKCQKFVPMHHIQWRLDIIGLLPQVQAQKRFILVAMDYFLKWIET